MKKVVVTGANGFIGKHSLEFLVERGFEVHAVTLSGNVQGTVIANCKWHTANLLDFDQVNKLIAEIRPSHLLHFSWDVTPGLYLQSNENFKWLQASIQLIQAFHQYGGKRVVMAGTCFEYDLKYGYCSEQYTPLHTDSVYGLCKNSLNALLNKYSEKNGLSAAWGRIFYLYGPGEHPARLISSIISSLLQGEIALCSHGNQIRDYLHVNDVAEAFVTILDSEVIGNINICSGIPITLKEMIEKTGKQLGRPELIKLGAVIPSSNEPPLIVGNPQRLQNELKWFPKYSLDAGLADTVAWWKKYLVGE